MPSISNQQLRLSFLRVVPGHEERIVANWAADRKQPGPHFYRLLGHYDLLVLRQLDQDHQSISSEGFIDGILCSKDVFCYTWTDNARLNDTLKRQICAVLFIRYNPDLGDMSRSIKSEVPLELRIVELLERDHSSSDFSFAILGTFASAQTVLLIGADIADDLIHGTASLIGTAFDPDESIPVYRSTLTILGLSWTKNQGTANDIRNEYLLRGSHPEVLEDAIVSIDMSCRTCNIGAIASAAETFWSKAVTRCKMHESKKTRVLVPFGPSDIHVEVPLCCYNTLGEIHSDLFDFRSANRLAILASDTRIELSPQHANKLPVNLRIDSRSVIPIVTVPVEKAAPIASMEPEANFILHCLYSFSDRLQDEGGDELRDMVPFYRHVRNVAYDLATRSEKVTIGDELRDLYALLEKGQIGQIQRMEKDALARPSASDLGLYRIGIRRILWALQSVPHHVLRALLRHSWRGFVLGGRLRDAFRTMPPIMNVPAESLAHPETWWVLSHEGFHDYIAVVWNDLIGEFKDDPWLTAFRTVYFELGVDIEGPIPIEEQERLEKLAIECLCDSLEYRSVEGLIEWDEYLQITISHVIKTLGDSRDVRTTISYHLIRMMFVLLTRPPFNKGIDVVASLWGQVQERVLEHIADLPGLGTFRDLYADTELRNDVERTIEAFIPITRWFMEHDPFEKIDAAVRNERTKWKQEYSQRCWDLIQRGEVVPPSTLRHPDLFVWFLASRCKNRFLNFNAATAGILSLLWFFVESAQLSRISEKHRKGGTKSS